MRLSGNARKASLHASRLIASVMLVAIAMGADCVAEKTAKPRIRLQRLNIAAPVEEPGAPSLEGATHVQTDVLRPTAGEQGRLTAFCLTDDGHIVALIGHGQPDAELDQQALIDHLGTPTREDDKKLSPAEVRILAPDGKVVEKWPVDFAAQAVNIGVDGNVVLGGDGVLARYEPSGKELARAEAPHLVASRQDPEALDRQAREIVVEQAKSIAESLKQFETQKEELDAKEESELTEEERQLKAQIDATIRVYRQIVDRRTGDEGQERQVEQMKRTLLGMQRKVNAIAAGEKHVFITTSASKGFGYSVWRTDLDFTNPVQIVEGLRGCCGQMDVQCCEEELIVAENSRHRVVRYDGDGKQIVAWGKRSRGGEGETFGGCCNPMNTRLAGDKLYVAESDGRVKLYTLDGEYVGLVGKANVEPGCKSSIVEVSPDGNLVYCFDVQRSAICVLTRQPRSSEQASAQ